MKSAIFERVLQEVCEKDSYFIQWQDTAKHWGLNSLRKVTYGFRILGYWSAPDSRDAYLRLGESNANECLQSFASAVVYAFGTHYLPYPSSSDLTRIL